jgi:hypothetical protein
LVTAAGLKSQSKLRTQPKVRATACWSLRGFSQPPPELLDALIESVGSTDPRICYAAMTTFHHHRALPELAWVPELTNEQLEGLVANCCATRLVLAARSTLFLFNKEMMLFLLLIILLFPIY